MSFFNRRAPSTIAAIALLMLLSLFITSCLDGPVYAKQYRVVSQTDTLLYVMFPDSSGKPVACAMVWFTAPGPLGDAAAVHLTEVRVSECARAQ